jgi:hypothetical protein
VEQALGQFVLYDTLIDRRSRAAVVPGRSDDLYKSLLDNQVGRSLRDTKGLAIVTFDPDREGCAMDQVSTATIRASSAG